jgi:hypothetical protein
MAMVSALAFVMPHPAMAGADHTLTIDGTTLDLPIGEDVTTTLKDGRTVTLRLALKPVLSYQAKGVAFQYPSGLSVSARKIDGGITQHMIATATGTMLILQTYDDINTATLIDLMTGKMTDDDVSAGATRDTKPHIRRLQDGTEIAGTRTTLKATSDNVVGEVLAKRQGRGGALLITRHDLFSSPEDGGLIETFWSSLKLD